MPEADGDDQDDSGTAPRPVPDPLDRVWRHPSEMKTTAPRRRGRRTERGPSRVPMFVAFAAAVVGGSVLTVAILALIGAFDDASPKVTVRDRLLALPADAALANAAAAVRPAVVAVTARDARGVRHGAAVCIRQGTDLLTTTSTVGTAQAVDIVTANGTRLVATVIGRDASSGLALLRVTGDIPAAKLAIKAPKPGDSVFAVGARGWLAVGTVNSVQLVLADAAGVTMGGLTASSLAESDDASGGALVDRSGAVAGIQLGSNRAAVPIAYARAAADELRRQGWVEHGWIGVSGRTRADGVEIQQIAAGSPAAVAGIHVGDLVLDVDGDAVRSMAEVMAHVRTAWPGDQLVVTVARGTERIVVRVQASAKATGSTTTAVSTRS